MKDLSITFCGITFRNPFILPSGIITEIAEHKKAIAAGVGGVTLKSITLAKREGNPIPRVWKFECGMLNSVGLRNPGIKQAKKEIKEFLIANPDTPIIVSLFAAKVADFVSMAYQIAELNPQFIELNLSCPNVETDMGQPLGMDKGAAGLVVKKTKKVIGHIPLLAKLTANVENISEIARSCEEAGADAITAINALSQGMIIDITKEKPVMGLGTGALSGPAIFPIALRSVYEIYEAVSIPIVGVGGVTTIDDVLQMFMAGATLIGVGTATYLHGMKIYNKLHADLLSYMETNKINKLSAIIGLAHHKKL